MCWFCQPRTRLIDSRYLEITKTTWSEYMWLLEIYFKETWVDQLLLFGDGVVGEVWISYFCQAEGCVCWNLSVILGNCKLLQIITLIWGEHLVFLKYLGNYFSCLPKYLDNYKYTGLAFPFIFVWSWDWIYKYQYYL